MIPTHIASFLVTWQITSAHNTPTWIFIVEWRRGTPASCASRLLCRSLLCAEGTTTRHHSHQGAWGSDQRTAQSTIDGQSLASQPCASVA
ncbi:hypothetical protein P168DRAFT_90160 [Aspergillus campestris IBT 28561]|uniref:Secreted protein n=1 Tax=Aspergillus campestris (strain IBT 28561) TaxID=1392248 RepID=A0A2I1DBE2_ASPC2|nr:uncharacterized protein P168DRAFT_90160 [Aspergillus campestris IBT 28561]PKY07199.1 hypothetical protein P168DRAFT_90160 [Aspergillus campestris IBT 28561]